MTWDLADIYGPAEPIPDYDKKDRDQTSLHS